MNAITKKARTHPLITIVSTAVIMFAAITGAYEGAEVIDRVHTTEAELATYDETAHPVSSLQFAALQEDLAEAQIVNKCRWLKSEIRALEQNIYVRERDGGNADHIHDLEQDLKDFQDQYDALDCVMKLA